MGLPGATPAPQPAAATALPSSLGSETLASQSRCVLGAASALAVYAATQRRCRLTTRRAAAIKSKEKMKPGKYKPDLDGQVVDEEAMLAESTFPIKPKDLIKRCKDVLSRGVGTKEGGEADLADDFEFCAPVVGPIGKDEYLRALGNFKILEGFPDNNGNFHHFRVDPFEPNRVWFVTRKSATNTGEFLGKPATGKALVFPPESCSMIFNEEGKLKEYTIGYCMDRRVGNTGGLGGAFGYFYGVGKPLPMPECKPYKRSWQFRLLSFIGNATRRFQK